jgi:hypothetical protein
MVRGQGTVKAALPVGRYLSNSEIDSINEEKQEMLQVLKEIESGAQSGQQIDAGKIKREIAHLDDVIRVGSAPEASGKEKDRLAKEQEELESTLRAGMPTVDEMRHPARNPGAVKKHMRWGERNFANIQRYVAIQKVLNPDEPKSIENLRKEK